MFDVTATFTMGTNWRQIEDAVVRAAGVDSDLLDISTRNRTRSHVWLIKTFNKAMKLKWQVETVKDVLVTVREHTTEE